MTEAGESTKEGICKPSGGRGFAPETTAMAELLAIFDCRYNIAGSVHVLAKVFVPSSRGRRENDRIRRSAFGSFHRYRRCRAKLCIRYGFVGTHGSKALRL